MNLKGFMAIQDNQGVAKTDTMLQLGIKGWSIKENIGKTDSQVIGVGRFVADGFVSSKRVSGDIPLEPTMLEISELLKGSGYVGTEDTPNKKITFKASDSFSKYITFALSYLADDLKEVTKDCLVNSLKFGFNKESYIDLSASILGMELSKSAGKLEPTLTTNNGKRLTCLGIIIKKDDSEITANIESADLNLTNGLEAKGALNKTTTRKITQNAKGTVTISLKYNSFDKEEYLKADRLLSSNGNTSLEIMLGEDVEESEVKKASAKKLVIKLPNVKYTNNTVEDLNGQGALNQELTAYPDSEGQPIIFEFYNM